MGGPVKVMSFVAAIALLACAAAPAQQSDRFRWDELSFMQGKWVGEGTNETGPGSGYFTFEPELLGTVWLRRNHSEYPGANNHPPAVHEDLMIVYAGARGTEAFYTDTEGHTIVYGVTVSEDKQTATFLSAQQAGQPRYRLIYLRLGAGRMSVVLEMAPADRPDQFKRIVEGVVRKV
jgi:hypothetical protein